jgi:hypothetical protein
MGNRLSQTAVGEPGDTMKVPVKGGRESRMNGRHKKEFHVSLIPGTPYLFRHPNGVCCLPIPRPHLRRLNCVLAIRPGAFYHAPSGGGRSGCRYSSCAFTIVIWSPVERS